MPTTDSNLTGTFIANTYQKLLQVDSQYGSIGTTAPFVTNDARTTTKYNLLNGLGQSVPYVVIDHTAAGDGSVFLKNTGKDPNSLWGIQIENSGDAYGSSGLNFWRPFGSDESSGNNYLFLKNTGTTWVGFQSQNIFDDIIETSFIGGYRGTYTLYVSDGILVKGVSRKVDNSTPTPSLAIGAPTDGTGFGNARTYQKLKLGNDMTDGSNSELSVMSNTSTIRIYGSSSNTITAVDNNFNFFMIPYSGGTLGGLYHPFRIIRYKYDESGDFESPRSRPLLGDGNGNPPNTTAIHVINSPSDFVDVDKWIALLVGWTRTTVDAVHEIDKAGCIIHCNPGENYWRVSFTISGNTGKDQDWYFDVMFIRKGLYDDYRPNQIGDGTAALNHGGPWGAV